MRMCAVQFGKTVLVREIMLQSPDREFTRTDLAKLPSPIATA
jgi:hypothetical protein